MNNELQELRSKANEFLLREEWKEAIDSYAHLINLLENQNKDHDIHSDAAVKRPLCIAFANRAEALLRLKDFDQAISDCDRALKMDGNHLKSVVCKGKALLELDKYSRATECFQTALALQPQGSADTAHAIRSLLDRSRKLEVQSRTGNFDLTSWILNGFEGPSSYLAQYLGPVVIRRSGISGRGLFATKNVSAGTLLFASKPVAVGRAILPSSDSEHGMGTEHNNRLVIWKDFVDQIRDVASKSKKTLRQIYALSTGEEDDHEDEDEDSLCLDIPNMDLFKPDEEGNLLIPDLKLDMERILKVLDVNASTEIPVLRKKSVKNREELCGIGLWILASFVNHSCSPNSRRLHVGDRIVVHATKDLREGEEITFSYFDPFLPWKQRRELSKNWGFLCKCERCKFEKTIRDRDVEEIEKIMESGSDSAEPVVRLEEFLKKRVNGKREKGFMRISYWKAYWDVIQSGKAVRKWGSRIPTAGCLVDAAEEVVGGDDRVLAADVFNKKDNGFHGGGGILEEVMMSKAVRMCRAMYGKNVKKQAIRVLLKNASNFRPSEENVYA